LLGAALLQGAAPGRGERLGEFLRKGPNEPILLLTLYGAVSWLRSPHPAFSAAEWLRLFSSTGLYFAVILTLRDRRQARSTVKALVLVTVLTSLFGMATYAQRQEICMSSSFGN